MELSSRADSLKLPGMLDRLQERLGGMTQPVNMVACTSMFGTGVDVDRLGLMVVHGQPKTTSNMSKGDPQQPPESPAIAMGICSGRVPARVRTEKTVGLSENSRAMHRRHHLSRLVNLFMRLSTDCFG